MKRKIFVLLFFVAQLLASNASIALNEAVVNAEFARLEGEEGLWHKFIPMVDRIGSAEGSLQEVYNLQVFAATNFISRLQATTNDYVFSGKYDFVGASACVYKMCEWDVFHNSTNALMRFADGLGNVQPVVWEFGCTSNELEKVKRSLKTRRSIAGSRCSELTPEKLILRNKLLFQVAYNEEVVKFRKRVLRSFFEIVKHGYSNILIEKRRALWLEFLHRAKATEEERNLFNEW